MFLGQSAGYKLIADLGVESSTAVVQPLALSTKR